MQTFIHAVVKPELLKHQDREVKLLVATCICEITRITAPEPPYTDDILKVLRLLDIKGLDLFEELSALDILVIAVVSASGYFRLDSKHFQWLK